MKKLFSCVLFLFYFFPVFCQRVISPVEGSFSNRQCLVLNVEDGAECFYSFSGSDPLTSGFAYDGPVLIDAAGNIEVKILVVKENSRQEIQVNYTVTEDSPFQPGSLEHDFLSSVADRGVVLYNAENPQINIPASLKYSIGFNNQVFLPGKVLSMSEENQLSRYVPCTVTDGNRLWRFVIFVSGSGVGLLSKSSLPFQISEWNSLSFTGEKLIWSLDESEWSASRAPVVLDRSVEHTLRWQSVAYEKGNPVFSFVLPPEPVLTVSEKFQEPLEFFIDGDVRYTMELVSCTEAGWISEGGGAFSKIVFDTFSGDCISGEAVFAFYCDGLYQGTKSVSCLVDKRPPLPPVFSSSSKASYARGDVTCSLTAESGAEIFYAVSKPVKFNVSDSFTQNDENAVLEKEIEEGEFELYTEPVLLKSDSKSALFYKVRAYAKDSAGNESEISEFKVIIDEFNYYLDSSADELTADGSRKHPFASFSQALEVINSGRFSHFFVTGEFSMPEGEIVISSNCSFTALGEAKFLFPESSRLVLRSSSLEAKNIVFDRHSTSSSADNFTFFNLEYAAVNFNNCEIVDFAGENSTVFYAANSVVNFVNSGLTVQSSSYACCVSAVNSKVTVSSSRIAAVSQTCVNFSLSGGSFELKDSSCRVTAHLGRIAEISSSTIKMSGNTFYGEFDKKIRGVEPVWKDNQCLIIEESGNSSQGF